MTVLIGLVHLAFLLLYVPAFLIAAAVFVDGNRSQRPLVLVAWVPALLAFLAIPVACLIALGALSAGVLDRRSLLTPAALVVWIGAFLLARRVREADHLRHGAPAVPRPVVSAPADPPRTPLPPRVLEDMAMAAPVTDPPEPWRAHGPIPIRRVRALGFADDPETGREVMLVVSDRGRELYETLRGGLVARDPDPDDAERESVRMVGPGAGGLGREAGKWTFDVVADPTRVRVVLGHAGGLYREDADWWVVHESAIALRLMGFSWSGRTLVVVTDDELWWMARPWQARPEFGR